MEGKITNYNLLIAKYVDVLIPELLHPLIEKIKIKADGASKIFNRFSIPSAIT